MIKFHIKQLGNSKSFLLAVILLYVFLLLGVLEDLNGYVDILLLFQISTELGVALLLRPIAAALPISFFLMHEWGSHYYQMALCRSSCLKYAVSKVISAYIIGFAVPFFANLLLFVTVLLYAPSQIINIHLETSRDLFPALLAQDKTILALLLYITAFSLTGSIWSVVIVGVSVFTTNAYVLVAAPFLLERVTSYVFQLLGRRIPFVLCFDTSQSYALRTNYGLGVQFAYSLCLCVGICSLVFLAVKRRRKYG